jgi:hypothetical protein
VGRRCRRKDPDDDDDDDAAECGGGRGLPISGTTNPTERPPVADDRSSSGAIHPWNIRLMDGIFD